MLKVKEILLRFQEDTRFIEKVAKSNTIDKLYEVFCEYEYDSGINSFESEIYELLSNSDLVKESIDEEELERISGGASTRKKIMSVIALSSLAMGGIAPITRVDAENVTAQPQSRECGDTFLPIEEWEDIGICLLITTIFGGGYIYHRHMGNTTNNFDGKKGFEKALEYIKTWFNQTETPGDSFPFNLIAAVKKVEDTFFPNGKPTTLTDNRYKNTNLKKFPTSAEQCRDEADEYFVPLSWNNGKGDFVEEDGFMLHKVLFQYLCRMLCFMLNLDTATTWTRDWNYVFYLKGKDRFDTCDCAPDYTNLFNCMVEHHEVYKEYSHVKSQVTALINTLASMYSQAKSISLQLAKCGVFCGITRRYVDN